MSSIIHEPDPRLHKRSLSIDPSSAEAVTTAENLKKILRTKDWRGHVFGLGMAAVQIGKNVRVMAVKERYGVYKVCINPAVISNKWKIHWPERCFSVEGRFIKQRYMKIRIRFQSLDGVWSEKNFFGPRAAIVQHEIDHLEGKLISDRL